MTHRQHKIYLLRAKAQVSVAALVLFRKIDLQCHSILRDPNGVPMEVVQKYNQLVMAADLPLPEREQLLIIEE